MQDENRVPEEEQHLNNQPEKTAEEMSTEELQQKVDEALTPADRTEEVEVEEEAPEKPEEEPKEELEEEPEEKKPSRREQLRVQQLLEKMKQGNPEGQPPKSPDAIDYREMIDADDTVYEQLEKRSTDYGKSQYEAGLRQAETIEWKTGLRIDSPQVAQKYKFLDKNDNEFDPSAADAMSRRYLNTVGYNPGDRSKGIPETVARPNITWAEFVEAEMELADRLASTRVEKTTKNLKRQAGQTGLRPDGSAVKTKRFEDMTIEEANAFVNRGLK